MEYYHTQIGTAIIVGLLTPLIILLFFFFLEASPPSLVIALTVLAIAFLLFYSLTVQISGGILTCYFGIGFIRKRIPLSDIVEIRVVDNPWFAGWGIRWMPGYWLWNVSGLRAVEFVMRNGSRFRIGTDEPEILVTAIHLTRSPVA